MKPDLYPMTLLTVYYDGSCRLCRAEMREVLRLDTAHEITLIDCAAAHFDAERPRAHGLTQGQLMSTLHVVDALGDWHRGVDAFALIYATVGARGLARVWAHPLTRPFTARLHPWLVRHLSVVRALGLNRVAPRLFRLLTASPVH